ncbi:MAG: ribonuclease HI [Candidatus Bruticola sp.]
MTCLLKTRRAADFKSSGEVVIFTDGSCSGNPGPGGWAAVLIHPKSGTEKHISGGDKHTTNNRMEITAVLEGLKAVKRSAVITVFADSQYVLKAFKDGWLKKWQSSNWLNSKKKPVENIDLWKQLLEVSQLHTIDWQYVPGHKDHYYNELCDKLAREQTEIFKR